MKSIAVLFLILISISITLVSCEFIEEIGIFLTSTEAFAFIDPLIGGDFSGVATFIQDDDTITLYIEIEGLPPGDYAVHIHEYGDCSSPDGTSAGGHWNPTNTAHGEWGEGEFHLGDIGNITIGQDGTGAIKLTTDLWEIGTGSDRDVVGKSIILHAGADDFTSQLSGAAGARIGCGAILLPSEGVLE